MIELAIPNPDAYPLLFALAHLLGCAATMFIALCRLNAMEPPPGRRVRLRVRLEYTIALGVCFVSAVAPLYGEWPGYHSLLFSWGCFATMLCSSPAWAGDRPPESATQPGDLRPHP